MRNAVCDDKMPEAVIIDNNDDDNAVNINSTLQNFKLTENELYTKLIVK